VDGFQIGLLAAGVAVVVFVGILWAASRQEGKFRGVVRCCELAVLVHGTTLSGEELLEQLKNHWQLEDLTRLDKILTRMSPMDQLLLFGHEWKTVHTKYALTREERAVVDEFTEDCFNICS
jgi:hypothetical protein